MQNSVKSEIEKHRMLLNFARTLNYKNPESTVADLERELEDCLAAVREIKQNFGGSVRLNDPGATTP